MSKIRKVYAELNDRNAVTQKRPEYIAKIRIVHAENDRNEMHQIGQKSIAKIRNLYSQNSNIISEIANAFCCKTKLIYKKRSLRRRTESA